MPSSAPSPLEVPTAVGGRVAPALSPVLFLERAARMFPARPAVVDGDRRWTYREMADRVARQRAALRDLGVGPGDRVAVLAPNTAAMVEAHFSVPGLGAVLVALNTRLTTGDLEAIVEHAGARLLLVDPALEDVAEGIGGVERVPTTDLADRARSAEPVGVAAIGELDVLALNYTSGTTGRPKGAMYSHRSAYLQAMAMAYHTRLGPGSVHLWTLPMFHCNGWSFPWAVTGAGGTHLCLPAFDPEQVWAHLRQDGVTHLEAAPAALAMLAWDAAAAAGPAPQRVRVATGGAPPSPALLERMAELHCDVTHLYGLTETLGPVVVCDWQPEWDALPAAERARLAARQGSGNISGIEVRVVTEDGAVVAEDGEQLGELQVRGNIVMLGYYRDQAATAAAFTDEGWFRTGDLGVVHRGGYVELRDRAKDVIISGGENIASIEVEMAIASHPAVLGVAVVSMPDERWGEAPLAHVELRPGAEATEQEIVDHARGRLAHFKAPRKVVFGPLPRTATGKTQKFLLREAAWSAHEQRIGG